MTKIRVTNRKTATTNSFLENSDPRAYKFENELNEDLMNPKSRIIKNRPLYKSGPSDDYLDSQFQKPPVRVPTKSIALAAFLCLAGSLLLGFGFLVITNHVDSTYSDRMWPMIIMGSIMIIPGFYHLRIAYHAYNGTPGFSFEDIPEFE